MSPLHSAYQQAGISLCEMLERVLQQSAAALEREWQGITQDFIVLAEQCKTADQALMERLSQSIQYQDRHTQILEGVTKSLRYYRHLLATDTTDPASLLESAMTSLEMAALEKNFNHMLPKKIS